MPHGEYAMSGNSVNSVTRRSGLTRLAIVAAAVPAPPPPITIRRSLIGPPSGIGGRDLDQGSVLDLGWVGKGVRDPAHAARARDQLRQLVVADRRPHGDDHAPIAQLAAGPLG